MAIWALPPSLIPANISNYIIGSYYIVILLLISIEHLHVVSYIQVVVYSLGLAVLDDGTLVCLCVKLSLNTELTDAEWVRKED